MAANLRKHHPTLMKPSHSLHGHHRATGTVLAALGLVTGIGPAMAQSVLITPPISVPSSSSGAQNSNSGEGVTESGSDSGITPIGGLALQWRKLTFHPHVSYQFVYGSGILSSTNRSQKTIIQTFSPGVTVNLGEHWTLDYVPSFVFYSDNSFNNAWNNLLNLRWNSSYEDWDFGSALGLNFSNNPQTETGQQTEEKSYSASLSASRQLNRDLSMELSAEASINDASSFNSSRNYSTLNWLNQQYGPNLGGGIGVGFGYDDVDTGSDMTSERLLARMVWHVTGQRNAGRLDFSLNGGPEFRQYLDSNQSSTITPVFGGSLVYQIFEPTTLSLNGSRSVAPSLYNDLVTETTSVSASLNQRFLGRYFLGLSGGYSFTSYQSSGSGGASNRSDNTPFFSASISRSFLRRGSASIFYSWSENASNDGGYSYTTDQVGFRIGYAY